MKKAKGEGMDRESVLIITGSMGAGKSTVLGEASDLLSGRGIVHAAIDMDALGLGCLPFGTLTDDAMFSNLRSVRHNYAALGVRRFLLARALESQMQLQPKCSSSSAGRSFRGRISSFAE